MLNKTLLTLLATVCATPLVLQYMTLRTDPSFRHEVDMQTDFHSAAPAARYDTPPVTAAANSNELPPVTAAAAQHNVTHLVSLLKESGLNTTVHIVFRAKTFFETACGIRDAFVRAGLAEPTIAIVTRTRPRRPTFADAEQLHLLLGAHAFMVLPASYIIYNLEQMGSKWMTPRYYTKMKSALAVAHFSQNGTAVLQHKLSPVPATYLPIYVPFNSSSSSCSTSSLSTAEIPDPSTRVDVGFYGSVHDRRKYIEKQLQSSGLTTNFKMGFDLWYVCMYACIYLSMYI
jgi:hypothetical protein